MAKVGMAKVGIRARGIVAASAAGAIAVAIVSAAAAASAPPGRSDAGSARLTRPTALTAAAARNGGAEDVNDVIDLLSPQAGFIGLGDSSSSLNGRAELMRTTNFGQTFTNIGPRTAKVTEPDSIFFLDRANGWFATYSVLTLRETVYRTRDAGRRWQAFAAPGHAQAAGSRDSLQFISPNRGWLVDTQPTGPGEDLYKTTDGGATWHRVASLSVRPGPGALPEMGRIEFEPNGTTGWLGGGMFSHALYRTIDGGRTWHLIHLRVPSGAVVGLPTILGPYLIEPVTVSRHGTADLRIYRSADAGTTWTLVSSLPTAARPICVGPLPTSIPNQRVAWAAAFRHHRVIVYWTNDLGRHWVSRVVPAPSPSQLCGPDQIAATAGAFAWLVTPGGPGSQTQVWATSNEGRSWRRIDLAALAAH